MDRLKQIWEWLKWPVGLGLMVALGWMNREGLGQLFGRSPEGWPIVIVPIQWSYLAASVVLCTACCLLTFVRWYLLVWAQEFPFRFRDAVRLGFIGQFYSYFAPGIVGGDIVKAFIVAQGQTSRRAVAVATVLLDRVLGLLSLFILGAIMTLFATGLPEGSRANLIVGLLWGGALSGLTGIGVMLIPGVTRWRIVQSVTRLPVVGKTLGELIHGVGLYQSRPMVLVGSVLLGLVSHGALISGFYFGARSVAPWTPDLGQHFVFMPIAETFATLVLLPGSMGGLEGAAQYFYDVFSQGEVSSKEAQSAGFIGAIIFRLVQLGISCVGYGYYLASRKEISAAIDANETPRAAAPTAA
jgi:hypothetical protein